MSLIDAFNEVWNTDAGRYLLGYLFACSVPVVLAIVGIIKVVMSDGGKYV